MSPIAIFLSFSPLCVCESTYVLPDVLLVDEKLRPQVFLCHALMVENGQTTDSRENEVLGHFISQRFHRDEQDVGGSQPITH